MHKGANSEPHVSLKRPLQWALGVLGPVMKGAGKYGSCTPRGVLGSLSGAAEKPWAGIHVGVPTRLRSASTGPGRHPAGPFWLFPSNMEPKGQHLCCLSYSRSPGHSRAGWRELWLSLRGLAGLAVRPGSEPRSPRLRRGVAVPLQGSRRAKDHDMVHIPNKHFIHLALKKIKLDVGRGHGNSRGPPKSSVWEAGGWLFPCEACAHTSQPAQRLARSFVGDFSGGGVPSDAEGPCLPPTSIPSWNERTRTISTSSSSRRRGWSPAVDGHLLPRR